MDSNNWFLTNRLVCNHVFTRTWEQKDINIFRLQGFFFSACSVQPLLSAVTQPETARCRRSQTQPVQSMYAQSPERKPLHERKQNPLLQRSSAARHAAFLTPASQVSLGARGRTVPNDLRRACNRSFRWIEKYTVPTRIQSAWLIISWWNLGFYDSDQLSLHPHASVWDHAWHP